MTLRGIDISYAQRTTPSLSGLSFVIVRACYGRVRDVEWGQHSGNVRRFGLPLGAYCFGRNDDGAAQAQALLSIAKGADSYWLDMEADGRNPKMTAAQGKAFIAEMHRQGYKCGLYSSRGTWPGNIGQDYNWVADYTGTRPSMTFAIWQYRGSPLDLDLFNGDAAALAAVFTPRKEAALTFTPSEQQALAAVATMARYVSNLSTHPEHRESLVKDLRTLAADAATAADTLAGSAITPPAVTPVTPSPTPAPEPAPLPALPPIALTPTSVPAVVNYVKPTIPTPVTINGYATPRYGDRGTAFVVVHGGPQPVGEPTVNGLGALGDQIVARGGQAFFIDYDASTWERAVADVDTAISQVRALAGSPVTVVAHSLGGYFATIALLRDNLGDALVAVCTTVQTNEESYSGPDPVVLAANRPGIPVSVVEGQADYLGPDRSAFVAALNKAGHPGLNILGPGDHTGTLMTDAALDAMFATAAMIR